MSNFKPAVLLYFIFVFIITFILGVYVAKILGAGEGQMLAAAPIVLGWGLITAMISVALAIAIVRLIVHTNLVKVNWILFGILVIIFGVTYLQYLKRLETKKNQSVGLNTSVGLTSYNLPRNYQATKLGIGFFQPNFYENPRLYFYSSVNLEKSIDEHLPHDSLVFTQTEQSFDLSYAPPWLYPEYMKMDYGMMFFKVLGYGSDFLKIETNRQTFSFQYIDKLAGKYISWPEFILMVNSIEPIDPSHTIHAKPLLNSSVIIAEYAFLEPLLVEDNWVYVKLVDDNLKEKGKGWVRWKEGEKLLIKYSLLS